MATCRRWARISAGPWQAWVLGDGRKAQFLSLPDEPHGLAAVRDKKVDVLFGATPNPVIGNVYRLAFGPPIFFDGQGF